MAGITGQLARATVANPATWVDKVKPGRTVIRPVSQVTLRLKPIAGRDRFASTIDDILRWMNRRAGRVLPDAAWQRQSFELSEIGAQRTAAIALTEPRYWAARLDDADKNTPLRTWVIEIGVGADANGDVLFGTRLICATRGTDEPFNRSIPGFLKSVLTAGPAELDGQLIGKTPRAILTASDVVEFVRFLESPSRQADAIVFSLPENRNSADIAELALNVHAKVCGNAHVFTISAAASYLLTERVGRELSVFRQAVRTYRPDFISWIDQPSNHPLALPDRISNWAEQGPEAFGNWLVNQAHARSVRGMQREQLLPSFDTVRQHAAQVERAKLKSAGGSDAELIDLIEQDNDQLRRELKEQKEQYDGLLAAADAEREAAIQDANAAKAQALERLYRIRVLQARDNQDSVAAGTPTPQSLEGFAEWCKEHLVGSVELVNRAFQGVRKSEYHDPQFIYRALLLLRDQYVPMRLDRTPALREAYERALADLQLEESATGDGIKYASDLYSVQYGGSRRALDRHLKGRDSRDRRYGFRLYFFWDDEGGVAVVGWLPSHLDNKLS
jgi:hypothetical protein